MGEEIKNVQLKFSCPANWDNMLEAEGGRHCDTCQKKAYDFTNSKAEEFQRILAENKHGVCGRFTREQMHMQPVVLPLWKKWLAAALVLMGINLGVNKAAAQQHSKQPNSLHNNFDNATDTPLYFNGIVGDVPPSFPGGIERFFTFVQKNILYNKTCTAGKVIVTFIIEKDGSVSHVRAVKSPNKANSREAIRVIKLSPKWIPATREGKTIKATYSIPIIFS